MTKSLLALPAPETRFPGLDAVRGLAFLLVLFSHIGNARNLPSRGLGHFGVWIFFVLSAFLLSHPFFAQPARVWQCHEWRTYFLRRALRILPPLLAALLAYHFFRGWNWTTVSLNLACLRGDDVLWTLFVEGRYYLLLPFVVAATTVLASRPWLLGSLLVAGLGLHLIDAPFWQEPPLWHARAGSGGVEGGHAFLQCLPVFVAGTLLARLHVGVCTSGPWLARLRRIAPAGTLAGLALLAALSPAAMGLMRNTAVPLNYYHLWWTPLLPLTCSLVFFPVFLEGRLARLVAHPAFRFFGKISYSGYLCHMIFVERLAGIADDRLFALAVAGDSVLVAALGHALLERPFLALSHPGKAMENGPAVPRGS